MAVALPLALESSELEFLKPLTPGELNILLHGDTGAAVRPVTCSKLTGSRFCALTL